MGLLARVMAAGRMLLRDGNGLPGPADDPATWNAFWYGGGNVSSAAQVVNARTATGLPVFNACVGLLSSSLAAQRWQVERDLPEGGTEQVVGPVDDALALTSYETKEKYISDALRFGTAYAIRAADARSRTERLVCLPAERMVVQWSGGAPMSAIVYRYMDPYSGAQATIAPADLAILKYRAWNGQTPWLGLPPLLSIGDSIGIGLAVRGLQSSEFRNGTFTRGFLSTPNKIDRAKAEEIKKRWSDRFSGEPGAYSTPVLEQGLTYTEIKVRDLQSLQLAELAKLNANDVCAAFNVPPSSIGLVERTTRSTIEDESRRLVSLCLAPLAARIGDAVGCLMLSEADRVAGMRVTINLESLVRGFGLELSEALSRYVLGGILTRNEARRAIGYPGRPDADELLQPVNEETVAQAQQRQDRADVASQAKADAASEPAEPPATLSAKELLVLARFAADLRAVANDESGKISEPPAPEPDVTDVTDAATETAPAEAAE